MLVWTRGPLLVLIALAAGVNALEIEPETGAYSGLVVAISETALPGGATLEEQEKVVQDVKALLQLTSEAIFEATEERVYLGSAVLLVPRSWSYPGVIELQERYSDAHIRVDGANPAHGDLPYTLQPHPCGVQGRYIHVTPAFVAGDAEVEARTGPPGRAMAHEWAHFRWGVHEEYGHPGDPRYPYFHLDPEGSWVPTGSNTSALTGSLLTTSQEACTFSKTGEPSLDCRFFPDLNNSASLMQFHHLDTPLQFSTMANNDQLSPSRQAAVCGLRSAWEVISEHPDLQVPEGGLRPPQAAPSTVTFTMSQPALSSAGALYLVLDISSTDDELINMEDIFEVERTQLTKFFKEYSDSARVAIYTYYGVEPDYHFTELVPLGEMEVIRDEVLSVVGNLQPTNIMVRDSLQPLVDIAAIAKEVGGGERGVVFFTQNDRGTRFELEALPALQEANLAVVGVGFVESGNAPNLFAICTRTGGRSFILDPPFSSGFEQAINFAGLGDDPSTRLYQVALDVLRLSPSETLEARVYLEKALGRETNFALDRSSKLTPTLFDPEGREIVLTQDPACELVVTAVGSQYICTFADAMAGNWLVHYTCNSECAPEGEPFGYSVTSYLREVNDPAWPTLSVWTSGAGGLVNLDQQEVLVYAELRAQYQPTLNALVTAVLEDPTILQGTTSETLRDDGREPDMVAGDGVYVAKMRPISANPMFLSVHVTSDDQSPAFVLSHAPGPGWGILPVDQVTYCCGSTYDPEVVAEEYRMERTLNKSLIVRVDNLQSYAMAPQTIEDLMVVEAVLQSEEAALVVLSWTAPQPRDGKLDNTVAKYELYFALSSDVILNDIDSAILMTPDFVYSNNLDPLPGGEVQNVTLRLELDTGYRGPLYFRIRSSNSQNVSSPLSHVTYANLAAIINIIPDPPDGGDDGDDLITEEAWFIALMVVLALALVASLIVGAWLVRRQHDRHARAKAPRPVVDPASAGDTLEIGFGNPGYRDPEYNTVRIANEPTTEL